MHFQERYNLLSKSVQTFCIVNLPNHWMGKVFGCYFQRFPEIAWPCTCKRRRDYSIYHLTLAGFPWAVVLYPTPRSDRTDITVLMLWLLKPGVGSKVSAEDNYFYWVKTAVRIGQASLLKRERERERSCSLHLRTENNKNGNGRLWWLWSIHSRHP